MEYKNLVLFRIPEEHLSVIQKIKDDIRILTNQKDLFVPLFPHVALHAPFQVASEDVLQKNIEDIVLKNHQTRITFNSLDVFNNTHVVLPIHTTYSLASLWTDLHTLECVTDHESSYGNNTLHITLIEDMSGLMSKYRNSLKNVPVPLVTIPVKAIEHHRKPLSGGLWELVNVFHIVKQ